MAVKTINKHELRTQETRKLLLQAAKTIFARDGYEGAELGEIAALAGRTKGAIYAQFQSKEDIFLAMLEDCRAQQRAQVMELLAESRSTEGNVEALRHFNLAALEDPTWALLLLEFKLFALRHLKAKKKFKAYLAESFTEGSEDRYAAILGPAGKGKDAISRLLAVQVLQPLLSVLVLEAQVSEPHLEKDAVRKVASQIFDMLFQVPRDKPGHGTAASKRASGRDGRHRE